MIVQNLLEDRRGRHGVDLLFGIDPGHDGGYRTDTQQHHGLNGFVGDVLPE
jgi:hypothetical protein